MSGRGGRGAWIVLIAAAIGGCGGSDDGGKGASAEASRPSASRPVVFVGFDASQPLVRAMEKGQIQGLVVQNPLKMAELSVKTMVKHLEKQPVEAKISTGETLVTPENMNEPDIAKLIHPPQVENQSEGSLSGVKAKKWRVMVIPKGTTHEFWKTIHAGTLKAAEESATSKSSGRALREKTTASCKSSLCKARSPPGSTASCWLRWTPGPSCSRSRRPSPGGSPW